MTRFASQPPRPVGTTGQPPTAPLGGGFQPDARGRELPLSTRLRSSKSSFRLPLFVQVEPPSLEPTEWPGDGMFADASPFEEETTPLASPTGPAHKSCEREKSQ